MAGTLQPAHSQPTKRSPSSAPSYDARDETELTKRWRILTLLYVNGKDLQHQFLRRRKESNTFCRHFSPPIHPTPNKQTASNQQAIAPDLCYHN
jgi:hypothetical protein